MRSLIPILQALDQVCYWSLSPANHCNENNNDEDQHYRHEEGGIRNWDSSDYGHVGEVNKGGVEADHGEGVGDPDQKEEGVRQQLEVHHLLENGKHPPVWKGRKINHKLGAAGSPFSGTTTTMTTITTAKRIKWVAASPNHNNNNNDYPNNNDNDNNNIYRDDND